MQPALGIKKAAPGRHLGPGRRGRWTRGGGSPAPLATRRRWAASLAQGCSGQLTAVQVERHDGPLPSVRAFDPPQTAASAR
ncbi:hypothetical protein AL509_28730 [Achromobacter xylosoxidans]|nr:hypothetical protein AL509_28730 [Achromobacter xylosoxidans]